MDFAQLPIMQQIAETCPSVSKPEDILNIPGSPSFVFQMPRGTQTPPSMPAGLDEEPEIIRPAPPPKGTTLEAAEEGAPQPIPTPTAETRVLPGLRRLTFPLTRASFQGKDAASDFPHQPEGASQGVLVTPGHWETSGIPSIDLQLPDPHYDPTTFPLYAAVGGALVDLAIDRGRGRLSGLEGQLKEALETFRASELHETRRAVIEVKAENNRLDKLWRDT
ncbi:OLC1v1024526C1 [Oldenlandia corymbosa var. corymbosa]|uniref:OLC1v1024526C1 n=1 Tax=Oldenlandia corymbosa var. corymbosa TaxID=529605 RepID=A0AAV1C506_OLDCO|nr:OLC1v1024526C1 [Oldenlandia corymbosa var. corymbosa]